MPVLPGPARRASAITSRALARTPLTVARTIVRASAVTLSSCRSLSTSGSACAVPTITVSPSGPIQIDTVLRALFLPLLCLPQHRAVAAERAVADCAARNKWNLAKLHPASIAGGALAAAVSAAPGSGIGESQPARRFALWLGS